MINDRSETAADGLATHEHAVAESLDRTRCAVKGAGTIVAPAADHLAEGFARAAHEGSISVNHRALTVPKKVGPEANDSPSPPKGG